MKKNTLAISLTILCVAASCALSPSQTSSTSLRKRTQASAQQVSPQKKSLVFQAPKGALDRAIEKNHYQNLVSAFDRNDERGFAAALRKMKDKHSKSAYIDDTLYLSGMWHFSRKEYGPALKDFQAVLEKYPRGNRAPGAMYAKGVVLSRLNLPDQAKEVFKQVKRKYPTSRESWRAQAELKSIR